MHDNTLARALVRLGVDVQLVPMYTPIQTDEADVSVDQVFFGGINVYLQQQFRLFRYLPRVFDRLLDSPRLLRWVGSRGIETQAAQLGELAVSMLQGSAGFQRKEVQRLCRWLSQGPAPHLINLTNLLVAGCAAISPRTGRPINGHRAGRRYLPRAAALGASNPGFGTDHTELPNMSMHCWSTAITMRSSWRNIFATRRQIPQSPAGNRHRWLRTPPRHTRHTTGRESRTSDRLPRAPGSGERAARAG